MPTKQATAIKAPPAASRTSVDAANWANRIEQVLASGAENTPEIQNALKDLKLAIEQERKAVQLLAAFSEPPAPPVAPPTVSADNGGMEGRIIKLEEFAQDARERLVRIETRLDAFATKEDLAALRIDLKTDAASLRGDLRAELHKELHANTWKIIGSQAALVALVYFVVKYVVP